MVAATTYAENPFTDMNYYIQYTRSLPNVTLSDSEAQSLKDSGKTTELFESVAGLVPFIIQKYVEDCYRRENYTDMVQEGNLAILQAIKTWKPHKGSSFSTWCFMYIRKAVIRNMRKELRFEHTHMSYDFNEDDSDERVEWLRTHTDDAVDHSDDGAWLDAQQATLMFLKIRAKQSERDRTILDMLLEGRTQGYIAGALQVSQSRVSRLVKDLFNRISFVEA